jgi:hypothetical protein
MPESDEQEAEKAVFILSTYQIRLMNVIETGVRTHVTLI